MFSLPNLFNHLIVQPIFNLLVVIYSYLPGHNFGLALILFTIVIRILLWPLVKKQLHQTRAMRKLQPEITKIKKATKGNRQKESLMLMELYKERGINPIGTFPTLIVQLIVLIGLYTGLQKVIRDPHTLVTFAYPALQHNLGWLNQLAHNIKLFDNTLFGFIDLKRAAIGPHGFYFGGFVLVLGSAVAQFFQAKQLLPDTQDKRGLRAILKEAGQGKQTDQAEVNAAVSRGTIFLLPAVVLFFTITLPAALSLYWLTGGIVAFIQQSIVLRRDETEMESMDGLPVRDLKAIPEAEVIAVSEPSVTKTTKTSKHKKGAKRRKK